MPRATSRPSPDFASFGPDNLLAWRILTTVSRKGARGRRSRSTRAGRAGCGDFSTWTACSICWSSTARSARPVSQSWRGNGLGGTGRWWNCRLKIELDKWRRYNPKRVECADFRCAPAPAPIDTPHSRSGAGHASGRSGFVRFSASASPKRAPFATMARRGNEAPTTGRFANQAWADSSAREANARYWLIPAQ